VDEWALLSPYQLLELWDADGKILRRLSDCSVEEYSYKLLWTLRTLKGSGYVLVVDELFLHADAKRRALDKM
jgi:hypothetical protein